jgi:hypothetical protein
MRACDSASIVDRPTGDHSLIGFNDQARRPFPEVVMTRYHCAGLLLAGSIAFVVSGCVASGPESGPSESVGTAEEAFDEATCETATANATDTNVLLACDTNTTVYNSGNNPYGSVSCTNTYLVEYDAQSGLDGLTYFYCDSITPHAAWWVPPQTSTVCNHAHYKIAAWMWDSGTSAWSDYGFDRYDGSWNGTSCDFSLGVNGLSSLGAGKAKVRIGVNAYYCPGGDCTNYTQERVEQWIDSGP